MLSLPHAKCTHILLLHFPLSTPSLLPPPFPHPAGGTPVPVRGPFRRLRHQADGAEHPPDGRVGYQPRHTTGTAYEKVGHACPLPITQSPNHPSRARDALPFTSTPLPLVSVPYLQYLGFSLSPRLPVPCLQCVVPSPALGTDPPLPKVPLAHSRRV